jgi:hypothetical protein
VSCGERRRRSPPSDGSRLSQQLADLGVALVLPRELGDLLVVLAGELNQGATRPLGVTDDLGCVGGGARAAPAPR